jgi:hypothetical protein
MKLAVSILLPLVAMAFIQCVAGASPLAGVTQNVYNGSMISFFEDSNGMGLL